LCLAFLLNVHNTDVDMKIRAIRAHAGSEFAHGGDVRNEVWNTDLDVPAG
jgi:hypothetical protein